MSGLPYRIRAPLARLQEKKKAPAEGKREAGLGDGEKLETNSVGPDYVRLALTSRVYDLVSETPLQHASGLSQRLQVPFRPRAPTHPCAQTQPRRVNNPPGSPRVVAARPLLAVRPSAAPAPPRRRTSY